MLFDLDHFKRINDSYGHLVGDKVLQHISALLSRHIRTEDILSRFGGEEFLLLLPMTEQPAAEQVANKLADVIRQQPLQLDNQVIHLTTSIGIAVAGPASPASNSETMLQQADQALYSAKANGRDQVITYCAVK